MGQKGRRDVPVLQSMIICVIAYHGGPFFF